MRRRLAFVGLTLPALILQSCGSFTADDSPFGDTSDTGAEASTTDAGASADGGKGLDAAGPPADADDAASWCSQQEVQHAFCADFDGVQLPGALTAVVSSNSMSPMSTIGVEGSGRQRSLALKVEPSDPNLQLFADYYAGPGLSGIACSFDVSLDTQPNDVGTLVWVRWSDASESADLRLSDRIVVTTDGSTNFASTDFVLPGPTVVRIAFRIDVANGTLNASIGNTETQSAVPKTGSFSPTIKFGTLYPNNPKAFTIRYDNILCDPL